MVTRSTTIRIAVDARKARDGSREARRAMAGMRTEAGTLNRTLGRLGVTLAGGLGIAALGRAFLGAIRTTGQFNDELLKLQAVSRASGRELAQLSQTARQLGATTRFSASEAAQGLTFLARAGFTTQEQLDAIGGTLDLAAAGFLELGTAADIASNVVSQFNLEASETGRVGDVLVAAASRSNTNVQQLAEALKFAGTVAGALNVSVEETSAALGVLGDSGIQASLAGTNLRGILAALIGPSSEARDVIEALGVSLQDVNPEKVGLIGAFEAFSRAGLSAAEASLLFGRRNVAAALALQANIDKVRALTGELQSADGEAERQAAKIAEGFEGRLKSLGSAYESLELAAVNATGALDKTLGVTDAITFALRELAREIESLSATPPPPPRGVGLAPIGQTTRPGLGGRPVALPPADVQLQTLANDVQGGRLSSDRAILAAVEYLRRQPSSQEFILSNSAFQAFAPGSDFAAFQREVGAGPGNLGGPFTASATTAELLKFLEALQRPGLATDIQRTTQALELRAQVPEFSTSTSPFLPAFVPDYLSGGAAGGRNTSSLAAERARAREQAAITRRIRSSPQIEGLGVPFARFEPELFVDEYLGTPDSRVGPFQEAFGGYRSADGTFARQFANDRERYRQAGEIAGNALIAGFQAVANGSNFEDIAESLAISFFQRVAQGAQDAAFQGLGVGFSNLFGGGGTSPVGSP